jgi:hypothetical protein
MPRRQRLSVSINPLLLTPPGQSTGKIAKLAEKFLLTAEKISATFPA